MIKTVFITLFQGTEAKNILRTNIYKNLIQNENIKLVLFTKTKERAEYYAKEFSHPRVVYEAISSYWPKGWDMVFSKLKFFTLRTKTTKLRRKMVLEERKNYPVYFLSTLLNLFLSLRPARKIIRELDWLLVRDKTFRSYFEKYKPDAVFMAHLFDDLETNMLREARRQKVKTVGFINSWDKLTARNPLRLLPEKLVVFNETVKEEALRYADMKENNIVITGLPQYDIYTNREPLKRAEFFAKKNLDPAKKLIVYAPMGKTFSNTDWDIVDLIEESINKDNIKNAQLLVRFQPNDFFDKEELAKHPDLIYDWPGKRFSKTRGVDWDMDFEDIKHLHDTLANLDVLVCYASSMSIDAAVFGKPVININFEINPSEIMLKSPTHFYGMTHYANAIKTGGINMPKSKEELINAINEYLENPEKDKEKRQELVRQQAWKTDGKAGERIANVILSEIK